MSYSYFVVYWDNSESSIVLTSHSQLQALHHSNPPNLYSFNIAVHRFYNGSWILLPQTIRTECLYCISISWQGACKTELWGCKYTLKKSYCYPSWQAASIFRQHRLNERETCNLRVFKCSLELTNYLCTVFKYRFKPHWVYCRYIFPTIRGCGLTLQILTNLWLRQCEAWL